MREIIKYNFGDCEQINSPTGRLYRTPENKEYPSVTTVLSLLQNKHLEEWKANVGEAVAKEISSKAAATGTKLHEACELYLLNKTPQFSMFELDAFDLFKPIKPIIDTVKVVHAIETRLWSDRLKVAGSVDLICEFDGELYIVDWKSSLRYKSRDEIHSYFMQGAAYALMMFDRTGVAVKKIRIIISTRNDGVLIYDENVADWLPKFAELRRQFAAKRGI